MDYCRFELAAMSNTSAVGAFVVNTYLLSTALCSRWNAMANLYNRWRIRRLVIHYVSQLSTTVNGRVGIAFLADADAGTATAFSNLMENRVSAEFTSFARGKLTVRAERESWLWTADLALNEDRLEYMGVLQIASGSFTTAGVPGYWVVEGWTEWCEPTNSVVAIERALSKSRPAKKTDGPEKSYSQEVALDTPFPERQDSGGIAPRQTTVDSVNTLVIPNLVTIDLRGRLLDRLETIAQQIMRLSDEEDSKPP